MAPTASRTLLLGTVAALTAVAARDARAEGALPPATLQPITVSFFVDRRLPRDLTPSLDEALRRLSDRRCAAIVADFEDPEGRRLDENLAAIGHSPSTYLPLVLFYDGRPTQPCESRDILAWTHPGSRAVHVCWNQFAAQQRRNVGFTANTIIHETLHTLGLGELPPAPRVITAKVAARCGN